MKTFHLPDPGEGLVEAEVVSWLVAVGDTVEINDIVAEIETAKSLVELPSPFAGTVTALLVVEGQIVEVGSPILVVDDGTPPTDAPGAATPTPLTETASGTVEDGVSGSVLVGYGTAPSAVSRRPRTGQALAAGPQQDQVQDSYSTGQPVSRPADAVTAPGALTAEAVPPPLPEPGEPAAPAASEAGRRAKPVVRRLARDLGVDLEAVIGTGPDGEITAVDVAHAASGAGGAVPGGAPQATPGGIKRISLRGVRREMVNSMISSVKAPQASLWADVDVTDTVHLIETLKARREFAGLRISPILVLARAVCLALQRNSEVNGSIDLERGEIVVPDDVNLGIAAATARGLVVPNIKAANRMNLVDLAHALNAMVNAAREGRITPADCRNGTFTITNVGVFGIVGGTPILVPGESAVLCLGAITRKPWVVGTGADERIEIRSVSTLTLTIDHRVLDGESGARFLNDVATILREPGLAMIF